MNLENYEEWDYRKVLKIDTCDVALGCDDEDCSTHVLSVRGAYSMDPDVDDYQWVKVASFSEDLLIDLIKNCISSMIIDDSTVDQRQKLENLLLREPNDDPN